MLTLIIHGTYHWKPRRVAFRRDYCRSCDAERLSTLVRTFDVLHVFWIPVLPIGAWSRWFCTHCGAKPHAAARTRRGFKIAGILAMALVTVASWAVPVEMPEEDVWVVWLMRIGSPLALAGLTVSAFRHKPEPSFKARLAAVRRFESWSCPLCGGHLLGAPEGHCVSCGAAHRPLPAQDT